PWVKSRDQFSPLPPNRTPLCDSGGEPRRGGRFVADWRVSRSVGLQMFLRSKDDLQEWARLCPLTLALSPNTRNVLEEREETMEMLGYRLTPRWGSSNKKRPPAASQ